MCNKIIWLVDENQDQLRAYQHELGVCLQDHTQVQGILPYPTMQDYIEPVLNNDGTVAIILDQKLKDTGVANYTGIELAEFLRGIKPKLPIYILTNYSKDEEEFTGRELNVEYILDKADFKDDSKSKMMSARILRHINIYTDILTERGYRFDELLKKSLKHDLSEDEYNELEQLNYLRLSSILAGELDQVRQLEKVVSENKKLLSQLKEKNKNG